MSRLLFIAAICLIVGACGSIGYHEANGGPICTTFCVDLPGDYAATAKIGGDENCSFLDVVDHSPSKRWYSVEWCRRKAIELDSADVYFAYWGEDKQQHYLATDFGKAEYKLIFSKQFAMLDGRPAVAFVGAGHHNGGKKGSVIVVAAQRKGISAVSYLLLNRVIGAEDPIADSDDFKAIVAFAYSAR